MQTPTRNSDTDSTQTDTDALDSDTTWTCVEGDRCPWKEQQVEKPAPDEEVKCLQLQTSQAVRRFLERLASLLLVRLLEMSSRCHWACARNMGEQSEGPPHLDTTSLAFHRHVCTHTYFIPLLGRPRRGYPRATFNNKKPRAQCHRPVADGGCCPMKCKSGWQAPPWPAGFA